MSTPLPGRPQAPQSSVEATYDLLVSYLHASSPSVLELDIVPSSLVPPDKILYAHPSLAIPKPLLTKLFLHAHKVFFSDEVQPSILKNETYIVKLAATSNLLIFDPNYTTAANFRKRYILNLSTGTGNAKSPQDASASEDRTSQLSEVIHQDLTFLTTLLTSPLHKHAKASTLWAHRLWIFRHYRDSINEPWFRNDSMAETQKLWYSELDIVLKAASRHPRNYYAWEYARQLSHLVNKGLKDWTFLFETSHKVHAWCLVHPRDISGWSFLIFWLKEMHKTWSRRYCDGSPIAVEEIIETVMKETKEWVRKFKWEGESVEWFLRAVEILVVSPVR